MMYLIRYSEDVTTFMSDIISDVNSNFIPAMETDNTAANIKPLMRAAYLVPPLTTNHPPSSSNR